MQEGATLLLQPSPLLGPPGPAPSQEVTWCLFFLEVGPECWRSSVFFSLLSISSIFSLSRLNA